MMNNKMIQKIISYSFLAIIASACNGFGNASISTSTAILINTKSAQLAWSPGSGIINGYIIEQSTDNTNFTQALTVGNTTSGTVAGLIPGNTYYFRVRTYNLGGQSAPTSVASLTIPTTGN